MLVVTMDLIPVSFYTSAPKGAYVHMSNLSATSSEVMGSMHDQHNTLSLIWTSLWFSCICSQLLCIMIRSHDACLWPKVVRADDLSVGGASALYYLYTPLPTAFSSQALKLDIVSRSLFFIITPLTGPLLPLNKHLSRP